MEEALDFLQSRPLIGFQMDGSHLNSVLHNIIRQQFQSAQVQRQVLQRLGELETAIADTQAHQADLDAALRDLGGSDKLNRVRDRLEDLEKAMDVVVRDLDETKRTALGAGQDADQAGRLADQAARAVPPLQEAVQRLGADLEKVGRESAGDKRDIGRAIDDLQRAVGEQDSRLDAALRELEGQVSRVLRDNGQDRLREMIEELSDRTDENFKHVEASARAVDAELTRQASAVAQAQTAVDAVEERTRARIASLAGDMDDKYQMLVSALREYEKSAGELEEHLAMAGQALARRRGQSR